jgi:carbamoyl-phosphate synthase large subunit
VNSSKPSKVLIIGSGPIIIGQAAEFDYAGTQACKAMREEGVTSVLVNSNPATIMTDEDVADIVYIEPIDVDVITRVIERERPDGLLPTLGGQTGLNMAVKLHDAGILEKYNVRLLGTPLDAIRKAEDRELFRQMLDEIGEPTPKSMIVTNDDQAVEALKLVGLPAIIRPAYTLGGTGGGVATTVDEYRRIVEGGIAASPIRQVLVEQSLLGWKEVEYEVMRDGAGNVITVCNMENFDAMGVHTGDSIVVAPSQTLPDKEYQMLRTASLKIISALGIEGGCNVQLALAPNPETTYWDVNGAQALSPGGSGASSPTHPRSNVAQPPPAVISGLPPYYVIEVNPRVSRSSALASKATGYPIARVAAKIAVGKTLDEIPNAVTRKTTAAFEPALDYVVVKIPRWPFDKFSFGDRSLGTQMKATGEVMAIDRTFEGALQKAVRSLEVGGRSLLWEDAGWQENALERPLHPTDERLWSIMSALRRGADLLDVSRRSGVDMWFLHKLTNIVNMEKRLLSESLTPDLLRAAKRMSFSDKQIATLSDRLPEQVRELREQWDIRPVYKMVDTCAAEFDAATPYFYSTYEQENEAIAEPGKKALVIGSGPIRIGQGIEFDYCSVHAAWALDKAGYTSIMANSNPETVSTDFDTSDRLYFEPLDEESVRDIIANEAGDGAEGGGDPPPAIVQFGGQTAINLAGPLHNAALPIIGSSHETIDLAEDRRRFEEFLSGIGVPQPPGAAVTNVEDAIRTADRLGYPVLVRPSYVLGGRAMEIVQNPTELARFSREAAEVAEGKPILIDKYLEGKEVEVDAICDGERVLIPGIMEHIERAGVHSGDSMAVYPGIHLTQDEVDTIVDYTTRIGLAIDARGLINVQYVIMPSDDPARPGESDIYVLEVNPRGSRTVPFLSKVTGVPMVQVAVNIMLGTSLRDQGYEGGLWPRRKLVAVKAPVFSMSKLIGVDTYLGPEMKSTGEVMGIDADFPAALTKALMSADLALKPGGGPGGGVLLSIADRHKSEMLPVIHALHDAGFRLYATEGTAALISALGLPVDSVEKGLSLGHPNVVDVINDGSVSCVINTPEGRYTGTLRDGFYIRRAATEKRIPCFTSIDTARAAVDALTATLSHNGAVPYQVRPLHEYREGAPA